MVNTDHRIIGTGGKETRVPLNEKEKEERVRLAEEKPMKDWLYKMEESDRLDISRQREDYWQHMIDYHEVQPPESIAAAMVIKKQKRSLRDSLE